MVLAQEPIERGEDKSEGELTVAPALVARVTWPGRVLTGDRVPSGCFCQRKLCAQVLAAGGDYLVLVKENQPTLLADLVLLFDPPAALGPAAILDRRAAATRDRGHGRQEDVRRLVASTDLTAYLDWPGLAQVFRLERTWRERGTAKHALLTSRSPADGPPERLLALKPGHWAIENRCHWVRDVTYDEERSQARTGTIPQIMAALRNLTIGLLRLAGFASIAAATRRLAALPWQALALLGCSRE